MDKLLQAPVIYKSFFRGIISAVKDRGHGKSFAFQLGVVTTFLRMVHSEPNLNELWPPVRFAEG